MTQKTDWNQHVYLEHKKTKPNKNKTNQTKQTLEMKKWKPNRSGVRPRITRTTFEIAEPME